MKLHRLPLLLLLSLITLSVLAQDRQKAEEAVKKYMSLKHDNYEPVEFVEFFEQNYAEDIEHLLETKKKVKYSISHNYRLGDDLVILEYFHLTKKMQVIGHVSLDDMGKLTVQQLLGSDELTNLIDSVFEVPITPTFPEATGFINDFEEILTQEQEDTLATLIHEHEQKTTNQIAIVTISGYAPYESLKDYAEALGNYWGVGTKEKNNGIVIAMGKSIRKIWISNGKGIEPMMSNERTQEIIDTYMLPEFKKGNHYLGIKKGLEAIINQLAKQ